MESQRLRGPALAALRASGKGRLRYGPEWSAELGEDILEVHRSPAFLSPQAGWILGRIARSPREEEETPEGSARGEAALPEALPLASPGGSPAPRAEAPRDAQRPEKRRDPPSDPEAPAPKGPGIEGILRLYDRIRAAEGEEDLRRRQEIQDLASRAAYGQSWELLKRFDEMRELKSHQEWQDLRQEVERSSKEAQGQQEKLKEEHQRRAKLLSRKLREAEQRRLRQEEAELQRREAGQGRLRRLYAAQEELLQANRGLGFEAGQGGPAYAPYAERGNRICGEVSALVRTASERGFPDPADLASADRALLEMRNLLSGLREEISLAAERRKQEEEAEKAAAAEKAENEKNEKIASGQDPEKAPVPESSGKLRKNGLQLKSDEKTLQWYQQLQDQLDQCVDSFAGLANSKDRQEKKIKMDLQKAVTTPVSQISTRAGSQLKEIFDKIHALLSGKPVRSGGQSVSVALHPEALNFSYYKLAEKFVKQGEEEVASHHQAAFPIAVVASGIWELHPPVGHFLLAHLHRKCPYAAPLRPGLPEGASPEEGRRLLGYQSHDSTPEPQDNFLKRMSGMIRLYAAILTLRWPYGDGQGNHPHGLNQAWRWLAQTLNSEPLADVTATILFDFLEVCGNALVKVYQAQFWKMIILIREEYLPRIEEITSTGQMGSFIRLKQFLEECLRRNEIPLPKGFLPPSFWRS
ncbi:mRNA export factor GLE1 [Podarcis raffonei]|uniref:mRNA export factor GLE1 n=1 Tax=Podarcis raffonei TaxID=65483 RepID=UPI0023291530|nr:mRNA export factor GLE1 [Podarcis raffonei]